MTEELAGRKRGCREGFSSSKGNSELRAFVCFHPHSQMFTQTFRPLALLKGSGNDKSNGERHGTQGKHPHATVTNAIPASQKKPALNPRALPWPTFLINTMEAPGERSQNLAIGCFKGRRVTVPPTTQGRSIAVCLRRPPSPQMPEASG